MIEVPKKVMPASLRLRVWQEFAKALATGGAGTMPSKSIAQTAEWLTDEYEQRWKEQA